MRRLSGMNNSKSGNSRNRSKVQNSSKDLSADRKKNRVYIDRMTEIADQLLATGITGVYDMTYEAIEVSTSQWEYKGQDGKIYGPFSSNEISQWKASGYLTGASSVLMRKVIRRAFAAIESKSISIYDDEDMPPPPPVLSTSEDQWILSDDIDFGEYINLDNQNALLDSSMSSNGKKTTRAQAASLGDGDDADDLGYTNKKRRKRHEDFDDDDD